MRTYASEALGTFLLVFAGCGSAVFAGAGIGTLGISFAFGLAVVVGAYAFGPVSGGHFNPAVTLGLAVAGRFAWRQVPAYFGSQLIGAVAGSGAILWLMMGRPDYATDLSTGRLAANGYGAFSPQHYGLSSAFAAETLLTFLFVLVILGVTSRAASSSMAGLAIGLCLVLVHLIGIPITNLSVNPARSFGPAAIVGGEALSQLWLFCVAPLLGAVAAGAVGLHLFQPGGEPKPDGKVAR